MANDNNIKKFTAADIEKYHRGQLSSAERHDLEKAALDDPFLADALEGFAFAGDNTAVHIAELKKRLADKIDEAQPIPMQPRRRTAWLFLRAAAVVVVLAGAGILVYQFAFNKNKNEIAQVPVIKKEELKATDSSVNFIAPATGTTDTRTFANIETTKTKTITAPAGITSNALSTDRNKVASGEIQHDTVKIAPTLTAPAKDAGNKADLAWTSGKAAEKSITKEEPVDKTASGIKRTIDGNGIKDQVNQPADDFKKVNSVAANNRGAMEKYYLKQTTNTFRGRVTDPSNTGLPFANVTNTRDNVGTYTDANGYFTLTSTDTILDVQVRSIGYENNNRQLKNNKPAANEVVLQEDRKNIDEKVISNLKPNAAARSRQANMTVTEPEPADGWDKYDSYLANNLKIPEDYKTQKTETGSVQVSFEVDKNGEPVNVKVEKSLCSSCDREAIRLIKDGPKWKRNAKKGRTIVTINF